MTRPLNHPAEQSRLIAEQLAQEKRTMKTKHTPGPWKANGSSVFAGRHCIALCDTDNATNETYAANARIMAAGLELLAVVKMVKHRRTADFTLAEWHQIDTALAKAEG